MSYTRVALVLDLENLVGIPFTQEGVASVSRSIRDIVGCRTLVAGVGCCVGTLQRLACFALAGVGVRVHGHSDPAADASDRLLLRYIEEELPSSADTVVIGSGDHIFAPAAARLRHIGKQVEVAAKPMALSAALYRECSIWHSIEPATTSGLPFREFARLVA